MTRTIQQAVTQYRLEHPRDCPELEDLLNEDILDKTTKVEDGWGNTFAIDCEGNTTHVRSGGKDGMFGTDDDLGF